MKNFMDNNFLLSTAMAQKLYHEAAAGEPIFDYHCHLIPKEIAEDRRFPDLASVWLGGDHYKWRAMRANGVSEKLVTGNAEPYDKFLAWADTVPRLIGNPLYHWTHLELQRYFDISEPLNPHSAPAIWKAANERLAHDPSLSVFSKNSMSLPWVPPMIRRTTWNGIKKFMIKGQPKPEFCRRSGPTALSILKNLILPNTSPGWPRRRTRV